MSGKVARLLRKLAKSRGFTRQQYRELKRLWAAQPWYQRSVGHLREEVKRES